MPCSTFLHARHTAQGQVGQPRPEGLLLLRKPSKGCSKFMDPEVSRGSGVRARTEALGTESEWGQVPPTLSIKRHVEEPGKDLLPRATNKGPRMANVRRT